MAKTDRKVSISFQNLQEGPPLSASSTLAKDTLPALSTQTTLAKQTPPPSRHNSFSAEKARYHVLDHRAKYSLVVLVSLAATFSPLASNIYFPAINQISEELHTSHQSVSLTVTTYMIAQGLAPSIWGPMADCLGRRQVLLYTLVLFLGANIGLALSQNIAMLIIFRFLQAAGSSSTISIGAGVIADIAPAEERGGFIGTFAGMRQFSMAIGPVLGGIIAGTLGFRYIFWILTILAAVCVALLYVLLPETLRAIAGNGSVPLTGPMYEPLLGFCTPWKKSGVAQEAPVDRPAREKLTAGMFFEPMLFLLEPDVACTLFFGAVIYTVFSMISASTSNLLASQYGLSTIQIGLCFLPNGFGCVIGSTLAGKQLDRDFRLAETSYKYARDLPRSYKLPKGNQPDDFPLEATRLQQLPTMTAAFCLAVVTYGLGVATGRALAVPLLAQFVVGYASTAVLNLNNTLTVDLYPGKSAAATAVNNLARCLVGALGVSLTDLALERVRAEYFFLILAGAVLVAAPLAWAENKYGMKWRAQRRERLRLRAEAKSQV